MDAPTDDFAARAADALGSLPQPVTLAPVTLAGDGWPENLRRYVPVDLRRNRGPKWPEDGLWT